MKEISEPYWSALPRDSCTNFVLAARQPNEIRWSTLRMQLVGVASRIGRRRIERNECAHGWNCSERGELPSAYSAQRRETQCRYLR